MASVKYFFFWVVACSFVALSPLAAKEIHNYRWRYSINVPADWLPQIGDDSSQHQVIRSSDKRLLLEINAWERRNVQSLKSIYLKQLQELNGSGVVTQYRHMGYDVLLARIDYYSQQVLQQAPIPEQMSVSTQPLELEGRLETSPRNQAEKNEIIHEKNTVAYVFYFYGAQFAYQVASVGPKNITSAERDLQYSVLDSFGLEGHNNWNWGPVSSFFIEQKEATLLQANPQATDPRPAARQDSKLPRAKKLTELSSWHLGNLSYQALQNPAEIEVAQAVLEREKRIMLGTPEPLYSYALARFYYMNFRQNFQFLKDLATFLQKSYQDRSKKDAASGKNALPNYEYLLYDLQTMLLNPTQPTEEATTITLELPVVTLQQGSGSIETLALINAILNSQFQYSALILYSPTYSQLLVGVEQQNVQQAEQGDSQNLGKSSRSSWYEERFLISELVAPADISTRPLADLQNWIPLSFPQYTSPNFFP